MAKIYDYVVSKPKITSNYGYRIHPISKTKKFHNGLDIISDSGSRDLLAIEDGYVQSVTTGQDKATTGFGNKIWIRYPRLGISLMYAHCKSIKKKKGDKVKKGDIVAIMGTTGASTGVHLHLGMQPIGKSNWMNPYTYNYVLPTKKYNLTRVLKRGLKGSDVTKLQTELKKKGYDLGKSGKNKDGIDGDFGGNTEAAVEKYQKASKLEVDGVVGKDTAHKLGWLYKGK